jgi:hypothetical protein
MPFIGRWVVRDHHGIAVTGAQRDRHRIGAHESGDAQTSRRLQIRRTPRGVREVTVFRLTPTGRWVGTLPRLEGRDVRDEDVRDVGDALQRWS